MRRNILIVCPEETFDFNRLNIPETPDSGIVLSRGFDDAIVILERVDFLQIISFLFGSPDSWFRFLSRVRRTSKNQHVPVVIDAAALTGYPDASEPKALGVTSIVQLSATPEALAQHIKEIRASQTEFPASLYNSAPPAEAIGPDNEPDLEQLQKRISELEHENLKISRRFEVTAERLSEAERKLEHTTASLERARSELESVKEEFHSKDRQSKQAWRGQQELIRIGEQNLQVIFKNTKEEILVLDRTGKAVFFNEAFKTAVIRSTGKEPHIGQELWAITVPERSEQSRALFFKTLGGENSEVEARINTPNTSAIHSLRYSPVFIGDQVEFVTVISTDITHRKKQEEDLRRSEENLKAIFNNSEDAFALLDTDLNIVAFNESNFRTVLEMTGKELKAGSSVLSTLPPEVAGNFRLVIQEVAEKNKIKTTTRYKSPTGEKWFDISIQAVRNNDNEITGYSVTSHNCTEIKKAEFEILRLNKSLINFQNAIQRSSIVSIADKTGNITFVNENFVSISGFSYNELIGKNHRIINSGYHPKSFWMNMWKTITRGEIWRNRVKNKAKNGTFYWVDTFIMPFKDEEGNIFQYLSIRNDITSIKNAEEELLQKKLLLQQASRISKMGYYIIDEKAPSIDPSPELLELLNLTLSQFQTIYADRHNTAHADLRKLLDAENLLQSNESKNEEFRFTKADGRVQWLYRRPKFSMVIGNEEKIIGTIQDITEQKAVEETLRQYNERFEILSRATNDAIWDLDLKMKTIVWSHAIRSTFGYSEDVINYTSDWWEEKIHPEDIDRVSEEFNATLSLKKNSWSSIYRFKCADGSYKFVSNRSYILYNQGTPVRAIGALQDITESVKATEEIQKLSLVASQINNGVMITDHCGRIEWVNESFLKLTGYDFDEVKGKKPKFLQGAETDPSTIRRMSERLKQHEPISEEIVNYNKKGEKFWLKLDIVPVFGDTGRLKNFISIQTDITELKEYENSITAIAEELATLIENANVPIFGVDVSENINEWNNVCRELFEYTRDEVLGKNYRDIFQSPEAHQGFQEIIPTALKNVPVSNVELPLVTKRGKHLILLASASPRRSKFKETTGVIFVGQNITELTDYRLNLERKVEERTRELHQALSKEQELVKMKNQFVSIASHEFRTPLTTISLAAGFIRKYKARISKQTIEEKVSTIEKQVNNMTYLLDDILVVGKADAGKLPVHLKPIEISPFIRNLASEVEKALGSTHKILIREKLRYLEIISDEKLLRNIVINLFTNAIKFSPGADKVDVMLKIEMDDLELTVKDYGIGIPEKDFQNIFDPFFRGANVQAIHGTGLGMPIIKKAVDLLQGSIKIESSEGDGTVFHIRLPI